MLIHTTRKQQSREGNTVQYKATHSARVNEPRFRTREEMRLCALGHRVPHIGHCTYMYTSLWKHSFLAQLITESPHKSGEGSRNVTAVPRLYDEWCKRRVRSPIRSLSYLPGLIRVRV